ncbi:MAG: pilus assembly protein PilM [Sedimentisphaerales bacterium]|nr:pilus assembly protein PilM [Sedimentisphaerales bacterium]
MISWALKSRGLLPIGLDIGQNSIKMIQLSKNGEQFSVVAAQKARIDQDITGEHERRSFLISAIQRMLAEGRFQGSNVISSLANDGLEITSLRLAEEQSDEIEQALRKEVVQRFGLDPDEDSMQYVVAGSAHQGDEIKNELILFAAANEAIKSHIDLLEQAGLRPVSIDTIPCALFRSFERSFRRQEDRERTVVFVDVGNQLTTVVFGRGGEISFVKQIPIGGKKFNQEIAAKLGVDISEAEILREALQAEKSSSTYKPDLSEQSIDAKEQKMEASIRQAIVDAVSAVAEELTREISLCLRYYTVTFRGKRVEQAFFTGGGAYEYILLDVLKRQLAVEVHVAQPLKGFDMSRERENLKFDSDRRGLLCEWAVAVGLSLKGWKREETGKRKSKKVIRV